MTVLTAIFTVLFTTLEAFVALSAVGGVTVAFEVLALAVGAGQGDGLNDRHESILTKPTTDEFSESLRIHDGQNHGYHALYLFMATFKFR